MSVAAQLAGRRWRAPARRRSSLRAEHGFTLMETLVAMLTGIVVISATFAILEISLKQTSALTDRVSANQRGRIAMEKIVSELHSSCVAVATVPVLAESKGSSLQLISQMGSAAYFTTVTKHRIYLEGEKIVDAAYQSNGGAAPHWTFPNAPTSEQIIVTGVSQTGTTPIFRFYKYEGGSLSSTEMTTPLSELEARSVDAVNITFTVAPETGDKQAGRSVELADTVLLRFDPASATGVDIPCS
jgi:hypothetical protein